MTQTTARDILTIPEIAGLDARSGIIRIPPELDVPLTPRVRRIVDTRAFRRLARVSQLGFVRLVYPGASHSRFEHSLGVYRVALLVLKRLAHDERFAALVKAEEAELFILAALLHDVGHFPFCHLLEDLKTPGLVSHEEAAKRFICGELAPALREDWKIDPTNVCDVLMKRPPARRSDESDAEYDRRATVFRLLASILSGPVDVDKMDYLMRDSCAAGVPYGRNYDLERLVGSVCLNRQGDGVAIASKGKTAAELMVFARYVMFSEVYWHHAARSATVMFQRAIHYLVECAGLDAFPALASEFQTLDDDRFQARLFELCKTYETSSSAEIRFQARCAFALLDGIFGEERRLFKRVSEFSAMESPTLYARLAGRPYDAICAVSDRLARLVGTPKETILLDAPPIDKEVEFKIDVFYPRENVYRPLAEVSPVVNALAKEQFDDYVKRVRIFATPDVAKTLADVDVDRALSDALDDFDNRDEYAADVYDSDDV